MTWVVYALVGYFAYLETSLGPIMPFLKTERGFSYTVASLHFSAFASGGVLIGLLGERAIGWWGRRASLWGGGAGMAVGAILLASSPATAGTILGALLMGTSGSLLLITTQAILSDSHGPVNGAVALTESNAAASACAIAASLSVGVFSAAGLGWRAAFLPPLLALVLLSPGVRLRAPRERGAVHRRSGERRSRLPIRFWACWGVLSLGVAIEWCITYWGATFLKAGLGLSSAGAAEALSVFPAAMLAGRLLGSALARFLPVVALLMITLTVALAGFPLFWLSGSRPATLAGLAITGLGMGSVYPLSVSAGVSSVPGESDRTTARLSLGASGAILLAPFALGAISDHTGISAAYGIVLPMLVTALFLMLASLRLSRGG
ncbi:MFS transporter [Rubrobacter calidifluminis]|uniref:MFS transporter n=1 Tax=Rubrobacter calidifluminis TaxID=1392640 RepID=UPI00235E1633|nr:MFS transporter [Rubrobacter calidifluminis]